MSDTPGILETRRAISAGETTPQTVLSHAFERAQALQPRLKAFKHLPAQLPQTDADPGAPLAGIAVAMKDLVDTADMPTTFGSPIHEGRRPERDAHVVQRLRQLGATVLGKSVTTEFAWRHPGPTANPWNLDHTPGGSSSGSAAAVGAGIVPLAIGSQTFGSVIRPAAYCGVVGLKPSYGAIGRSGVCPLADSLDHIGLFTRSVADAAYALALLAGPDPLDTHGMPLPASAIAALGTIANDKPPRIGLLHAEPWGRAEAPQADLLNTAARQFEAAGAVVVPLALPAHFLEAGDIALVLLAAEAASAHGWAVDQSPALVSEPMKTLIAQGRAMTAATYLQAKHRQKALRAAFDSWKQEQGLDVLLTPPAPGEAPRGLDSTGDARFCTPWSMLGVPAITLPAGFGPCGLPLGIQLVGAYHEDVELLRVAHWCERILARPVQIAER